MGSTSVELDAIAAFSDERFHTEITEGTEGRRRKISTGVTGCAGSEVRNQRERFSL